MIQGRYVKDDHFTEVYLGNGMTEIVYEPIKAFDINREKVVTVEVEEPKKNRNWIWYSVAFAVFLCGASFGAILQRFYYCMPLFIISLFYIGLVAWANRR